MISFRGRSLLQTRAEQHSDPDHRPSLGERRAWPYSLTTTVLLRYVLNQRRQLKLCSAVAFDAGGTAQWLRQLGLCGLNNTIIRYVKQERNKQKASSLR